MYVSLNNYQHINRYDLNYGLCYYIITDKPLISYFYIFLSHTIIPCFCSNLDKNIFITILME